MPIWQRSDAPVLEVESGVGVLDGEALGVEGEEEGGEEVHEEGTEVLPSSVTERLAGLLHEMKGYFSVLVLISSDNMTTG